MNSRFILFSLGVLFGNVTFLQEANAQNNLWTEKTTTLIPHGQSSENQSKTYSLKLSKWAEQFENPDNVSQPAQIVLPTWNNSFQTFEIYPTQTMHPALAAKYPSIKTYRGHSISHPEIKLRADFGPNGFHAMLTENNRKSAFIEPKKEGTKNEYLFYQKNTKGNSNSWGCHAHEVNDFENNSFSFSETNRNADCFLRTYRLALACTGEYTQYHGGSVENALAAMATTINRVNEIFERDLGVHLEMVGENDKLIFLLPHADPFSNTEGNSLLYENQDLCDGIIGTENYDIGHVFSTGGGGVAYVASVCNENNKACGVTGSPFPEGDAFDIDYVAHEIGHQFGANHTQNNPCNRNAATSVEPGSGSTIMGYSGVCAPNVQVQADAYFHGISISEIKNYLTGNGNSCASLDGQNSCPTADAGADYFIPRSTPFALTGLGTDLDGEDDLTFCWEQMDNQAGVMPPVSGNSTGPAFRSFSPSMEAHRYFPNMDAVLRGGEATWEVLPSQSRILNFTLTVRDNHPGGGCTAQDDLTLHVDGQSGPFRVDSPTGNSSWVSGKKQTVTWQVANTDKAPIDCEYVDILLSVDGGETWSFQLAGNTKNDGEQEITVPSLPTEKARIMIKSVGNIFFAVSDGDFPILEASEFTVSVSTTDVRCFGEKNGSATAVASGGEGNYKYQWSTGEEQDHLDSLTAGVYELTVTSGDKQIVRSVNINQPEPIHLSLSGTDASQGSNGQILTQAEGGNDNFTFQWNTGNYTPGLYHLTAGNYSLTVTDEKGCTASKNISLGGTPPLPLEYGSIENIGESWQEVTLEKEYENMVVVTSISLSGKGTASVVTRIKNAEGNRFEIKLQRAGASDYPLQSAKVFYFVAEEGAYSEKEYGVNFEAWRHPSNLTSTKGNWKFDRQNFAHEYEAPVVLGQVMGYNDHKWSSFWSSQNDNRKNAPTSFSFSIGKQAGQDTRNAEGPTDELGYLVFETGSGFINGKRFAAAVGKDKVRGLADAEHGFSYVLDGFSETEIAIVSAAGVDDDEGSWPVIFDDTPSPSFLSLFAMEDQCRDLERSHSTEQVAYIVFGTEISEGTDNQSNTDLINERPDPESYLSAYPTPSRGLVNLEFFQSEHGGPEVVVYDLFGRKKEQLTLLHAKPGLRKASVDLGQLAPGTYILQILEGRTQKTIKIIMV